MSERSITTIPSMSRPTKPLIVAVLLLLASRTVAWADENFHTVTVADPYLEMHTGPGRGYPKFHAVERGETVGILKRRTDWFLVRDDGGKEGWVHRTQLKLTLESDGRKVEFAETAQRDFTDARWEIGVLSGDYGGANVISLYTGYSLNPNVSLEVWGSQILGNFSNGWTGSVSVVHETWPEWRISPFFTLGAGVIRTEPKSTIVQGEDRSDQIAHAGAGVRIYATRRFVLRAEYKSYKVFTSRDDNEEVEEWKAGFAFFF
jgi:hypothetical protein